MVKNQLIKPDIINEIEELLKRLNQNYQNFGKAGIFVVTCNKSKNIYIGQNQNNIFDLFEKKIHSVVSKTEKSENTQLQEDADNYEPFDFKCLIDTDASLIDKNNRKKAIKDIITEKSEDDYKYDFFFLNDEDDSLFSDEEDFSSGDQENFSSGDEENSSLDEEDFSSLDEKDY